MRTKLLQSCLTLCIPLDCSQSGSSVHDILQAQILERLPCPAPGDLPNPALQHASLISPVLAGGFFTTSATWEIRQYLDTFILFIREGNGTHSSTLAWKIPWTEEPGRLQSMGLRRVGHDGATSLSLFTFHFYALEKEMATHSSVLAWRIPGMGSHRVRHDWSDLAVAVAYHLYLGFPGGSEGKESVCNAGDTGSIPGLGWSPGEGNGCPLQYSWLENSMDRGAWWATVPGSQRVGHSWVTNTFTTLSDIYNIGPL